MEESILDSVKKLLGIDKDVADFDTDLIIHINSVFTILYQLGVGPSTPFVIEDGSKTWGDFLSDESTISLVKSYMYLKVRLLFDITTLTSGQVEAFKNQIAEFEARLNYMVDPKMPPLEEGES